MHDTGECTISDLAEVCFVSCPTVFRTLNRREATCRTFSPVAGIDPDICADFRIGFQRRFGRR